jgi:hypothetical protein
MTQRSPMPEVLWEPAPCAQCGAVDMDDANAKCRPSTDDTGERYCAGEFNDDGISVQPTAASLVILNAWCAANADRSDGEQAPADGGSDGK